MPFTRKTLPIWDRPIVIGLFSVYCVIYGSLRYFLAGDAWGFLHYNLWLVWIPFGLVVLIRAAFLPTWIKPFIWLGWLAFLPNAPYLVTDLIHIRTKSTLPWFDVILIFHFALAGLLAGALATEGMEKTIAEWKGEMWGVLNSIVAALACGFGIVVGRDMRINSKDIFINPNKIVTEIFSNFGSEALTKSLVYAGLFGVFYLLYRGLTGFPKIG